LKDMDKPIRPALRMCNVEKSGTTVKVAATMQLHGVGGAPVSGNVTAVGARTPQASFPRVQRRTRGKHEISRRKVAVLDGAHPKHPAPAATTNNEAAHFFLFERLSGRGVRSGCARRERPEMTGDPAFAFVPSKAHLCFVSAVRIVVSWYSCPARRQQSSCDLFAAVTDGVAEDNVMTAPRFPLRWYLMLQ
jgi:hypothetical protein